MIFGVNTQCIDDRNIAVGYSEKWMKYIILFPECGSTGKFELGHFNNHLVDDFG